MTSESNNEYVETDRPSTVRSRLRWRRGIRFKTIHMLMMAQPIQLSASLSSSLKVMFMIVRVMVGVLSLQDGVRQLCERR
jgi:hypothetical protein